MPQNTRLEAFEKMLAAVQADYASTVEKMGKLKAAGKEKSATYRQLMGNKMQLQMMLTLYQVYGLIDPANEM